MKISASKLVLVALSCASSLLAACGGSSSAGYTIVPATPSDTAQAAASSEEAPLGQLPRDVTPEHYTLALNIVPERDRFSGTARIRVRLSRARNVIWLHGRNMNVSEASVSTESGDIEATWEEAGPEGVVALRLSRPAGPGEATIHVSYDAPYDQQLRGLYKVETGGHSYAFTQFEAISARLAFPCFDEPAFKATFDISLIVKTDEVAAANTLPVEEEEIGNGLKRIRYATTEKLPTYLIAWAVGPLDVVDAEPIAPNDVRQRPLPLRGIAVRGQGERLRYALEHTPRILEQLERWFGSEYPYDKLDIVAVPDFASGAMENAGLVTFREWLLLVDGDDAGEDQRRAFASVMAHELAHMWFGNLVTMPWWDDIWLNEAFATWMGNKTLRAIYPEYQAELSFLGSVHRAMGSDSLSTARRIRQPIHTNHDIRNAFDSITYSKGGGVLEMFERYLGLETFQRGIRLHLARHAHGTATADDLMTSLTEAAERDIRGPFESFITQAGVPFVSVRVTCDEGPARLDLSQARYLPIGSPAAAAQTWSLPICARYQIGSEVKQACTLLSERTGTLALEGEGCPDWVMPNADGSGYFRFSLSAEEMEKLRRVGWNKLTPRERVAVGDSLRAAFGNGATPAAEIYAALEDLASDEIRNVATIPMELLRFARGYLVDETEREKVAEFGRHLYQQTYRRVGWAPRRGRSEDGETSMLRKSVISFLALEAKDPRVRREAASRGRRYVGYGGDGEIHREVLTPSLVSTALSVAVQEGDAEFFDALTNHLFASTDSTLRGDILAALGNAQRPDLAAQARALSLDERLRTNEVTHTIWRQVSTPETRDDAWEWLTENFDGLMARVAQVRGGSTPWMGSSFCSQERAQSVAAFFRPRIEELPGGPRNLAGAVEAIGLCAARVEAHRDSARAFFEGRRQ